MSAPSAPPQPRRLVARAVDSSSPSSALSIHLREFDWQSAAPVASESGISGFRRRQPSRVVQRPEITAMLRAGSRPSPTLAERAVLTLDYVPDAVPEIRDAVEVVAESGGRICDRCAAAEVVVPRICRSAA